MRSIISAIAILSLVGVVGAAEPPPATEAQINQEIGYTRALLNQAAETYKNLEARIKALEAELAKRAEAKAENKASK